MTLIFLFEKLLILYETFILNIDLCFGELKRKDVFFPHWLCSLFFSFVPMFFLVYNFVSDRDITTLIK